MQGNKTLVNAPEDKVFWVHDGPKLRNLVDLRDLLRGLKESMFKFGFTPAWRFSRCHCGCFSNYFRK